MKNTHYYKPIQGNEIRNIGETTTIDDGYKNLIAAILEQAEADLRHALDVRDEARIKEVERFYTSAWGQLLSDGHGQDIIKRIYRTRSKKYKRISRNLSKAKIKE